MKMQKSMLFMIKKFVAMLHAGGVGRNAIKSAYSVGILKLLH